MSKVKIAIECGALRGATGDDVNSSIFQVLEGKCSDAVVVDYIQTEAGEENCLTGAMEDIVITWVFVQMEIDRRANDSVEAISRKLLQRFAKGWRGQNG